MADPAHTDELAFRSEAEMSFAEVAHQKKLGVVRTPTSCPLPHSGIELALSGRRGSGRTSMLDFVDLSGIEIYGEAQDLYAFGLICWKISLSTEDKKTYLIRLARPYGGDVLSIEIKTYPGESNFSPEESGSQLRLKPIFYPSTGPLRGLLRSERDLPSFGVRERERNADDTVSEIAIVMRQSLKGLNAFGRCLMAFAATPLEEMEEIHFEHGHTASTSSVGRISYEAAFYKAGSFAGDATFLCN